MISRDPPQPGVLFLVATPLGNLEDFTFRAVRVLQEVDFIAAEDTRRSRKLLSRYGIHTPLRSLHAHSRAQEVKRLVDLLRQGQSVAYVSDAGTPGVSDPGAELVRAAREAGIKVVPVPGPSAPAAAFSVAGLEAPGFVFAGYPPRKPTERREFLRRWTTQELPVILFEAPGRVRGTLRELAALVPERRLVIAREMSKQFEQVVDCLAAEAPQALAEEQVRGEFTLVVEGAADRARARDTQAADEEQLAEAVALLIAAGVSRRTIAQVLQLLASLSRNEAYRVAGEQ